MLIFDGFPSIEKATEFVEHVEAAHGLKGSVHNERRDDIDPFPYELAGPVVYVERPDFGPEWEREAAVERTITSAVAKFDGTFAGT